MPDNTHEWKPKNSGWKCMAIDCKTELKMHTKDKNGEWIVGECPNCKLHTNIPTKFQQRLNEIDRLCGMIGSRTVWISMEDKEKSTEKYWNEMLDAHEAMDELLTSNWH